MNSCWHILGAGSVGCLWGSHLALSGRDVTLLLRDGATREEFSRMGAIRLTTDGNERLVPVQTEQVNASLGPCSNILVTTKAHQTLDALAGVSSRIGPGTCLLLLQNGMGVSELVASAYPQATLFVGTTTEGVWRRERFWIVHAGHGTTWLGAGHSLVDEATRQRVLADFERTSLHVSWDENIVARLWRKLAINCVINPLTAICACRNGDLAHRPAGRRLLEQVCSEIELVLASEGIWLDRTVQELVADVARATAANRSSMLEDLSAGRKTEIDWINGYLVKCADAHNVKTPLNRLLIDLVQTMESTRDNAGHSR